MKGSLSSKSVRISVALSFIAFFLWIFYYFNALPLYLELLFFHKKVLSVSVLVIIWLLTMLTWLIIKNKFIFSVKHAILFILIVYMSVTTIIHCLISPNLIHVIGLSAFGSIIFNIALLLVLFLQMVIPGALSQKYIYRALVIFFVPVLFFGLFQIINGYSQITITIFNDYVKKVPYDFYGFNRPYSLFSQASNFGWFMAFMSGVLWFMIKKSKSHIVTLLLILFMIISMAANILSFTRVSIIAMFFIFVFILLTNGVANIKGKKIFLPFYFFGFTLLIFFFAGDVSAVLKPFLGVLSSSKSTSIRVDELLYYLNIYDSSSWWKMLIGIGPIVASIPEKSGMYIDNTYLYVLLHQGIVGLFLWILMSVILWRDMFVTSRNEPGVLRKSLVAYWSTWLAVGVFATDLSGYILMAILFYMLKPSSPMLNEKHYL